MFLRGEKVNVVLHWWNISVKLKGQQVIILQMGQLLQTKNISDVPYLCTWKMVWNALFEHGNFSRYMLEKKDYVGVSKGVHKQTLFNVRKSL